MRATLSQKSNFNQKLQDIYQLQTEESRGSASSPATVMAEEPEEITQEAVRNRNEEWFIFIFGEDGQQHDPEVTSENWIRKAPAKFREYEEDKKYFDPRVVSLGPYHHGKDHLMPTEKHKITAVKRFVDESNNRNLGRGPIFEKFLELIGEVKGCYAAKVVADLTDDFFTHMMFLDGCFVLYFILDIIEGKKKLEISNDLIPLIIWDMFLIENQLPFEVLDALTSLLLGSSSIGKEKILEFINSEVLIPMGMFYPVHSSRPLNWCRVVDGGEHERRERDGVEQERGEDDGVENDQGVHDSPLHLLDILRTILLDFPPSKGTKKESYRPRNFGSVMELKETGIRFEKRRMKSLMDISYKENLLFPQLLLPTMFINDTTISQLLNLTAFEMCSDIHSGCGVTSYICFLGSLINHGEDVKELWSKGILHHALGSDDEVALLFNKWPVEVRNDLKLYSDISKHIRCHRDRRVKISVATWVNKYFWIRWRAIFFFVVFLVIFFAAIRTYIAVFPRN